MDGTRFDRLTRRLSERSSRRRVLAGVGAVAAGSVLVPGVEAAPSSKAACMKQCNADAKATRRGTCKTLKSRAKNACLRDVQSTRATCRQACKSA